MKLRMELADNSYDITISRGALSDIGKLFDLDRKVMIVTDDGVPVSYAETVRSRCREAYIFTVPQGESSKSLRSAELIVSEMFEKGFSRKDAVVAVGGGVVGDLAGFAASIYMRGIDFYNVPTTILSQVDSSIGGKVAVDLNSYKNIIGAFYQPKGVVIDPDTLGSLSKRQYANGLVEAVKMGVIGDKILFELIENGDIEENIDEIIYRSLLLKKDVVEKDPKEKNLRKILNFGHTVGHGVETAAGGALLHGESVAVGMLYVCSDDIRSRLLKIYDKIGLTDVVKDYINGGILPEDKILDAMKHDKKASGETCTAVFSDEIGTCRLEEVRIDSILKRGL